MEKRSSRIDPYEPPSAGADVTAPLDDETPVEHVVVEAMRGSYPYMMLAGGVGVVAALVLTLLLLGALSHNSSRSREEAVWLVLLVLVVLAFLMPSLLLLRHAQGIQRLAARRTVGSMVEVLHRQTSFWRAAGILLLVLALLCMVAVLWALSTPWD